MWSVHGWILPLEKWVHFFSGPWLLNSVPIYRNFQSNRAKWWSQKLWLLQWKSLLKNGLSVHHFRDCCILDWRLHFPLCILLFLDILPMKHGVHSTRRCLLTFSQTYWTRPKNLLGGSDIEWPAPLQGCLHGYIVTSSCCFLLDPYYRYPGKYMFFSLMYVWQNLSVSQNCKWGGLSCFR